MRSKRSKRAKWETNKNAAFVFISCTLLTYIATPVLDFLVPFFSLTPDETNTLIFGGTTLVTVCAYIVSFAKIAARIGGSRKTRTANLRRVSLRVWQFQALQHFALFVLLLWHPNGISRDTPGAPNEAAFHFVILFAAYPFTLGMAAIGKSLSYRAAPAPEDEWAYGHTPRL